MSVVLGSRPVGTPEAETILASPRFDTAGRRAICGWGQSVTLLLAAILFLGSLGCTRSEPPQFVPPPSPAATKTPTPVVTPAQAEIPTPLPGQNQAAIATPGADDSTEDDHSDVASSATSLSLFRAVAGSIEHPGDVDLFVSEGVYGVTFEVAVDVVTLSGGVLTLYGPDAECVLSEIDQLSGSDRATLRWRFAETAPHYVSVQGASDVDTATGAYTLILTTTQEEPDDDHGDAVCSASTAVVGLSYSGMIEHSADVDVLGFEVTAGTLYRAVVQLGTLGDSRLVLLDTDGETELDRSEEFGESSLEWTPSESGTYYLIVEGGDGAFNPEGTYILTVSDQMPSPTPSPTPIPPGPSPTPLTIQDGPYGPVALYESADHPFSIQYPAGWTQSHGQPEPGVVTSLVGPVGETLTIVEEAGMSLEDGLTLDDYVDAVLDVVGAVAFNYELESRDRISTPQGLAAELVEYTTLGGTFRATIFIYLDGDGVGFHVTYSALTPRHAELGELVAYSLSTFQDRSAPPAPTPTPRPAGILARARSDHTATLLPDGTVLVAGGQSRSRPLRSAEVYDPSTGAWSTVGNMVTQRSGHTATLLLDGRVLVVGGALGSEAAASAEVYDPVTATWQSVGSPTDPRSIHSATLLSDGQVLIVGGVGSRGLLSSAELFDPADGSWTSASPMDEARSFHTATLLGDGSVLIAGGNGERGILSSAEVYDPEADRWSSVGNLVVERFGHGATLLADGRVFVVGGTRWRLAEAYDPSTRLWSSLGASPESPELATVTLLNGGIVLVAGGIGSQGSVAGPHLYDPVDRSWRSAGSMVEPRANHTAVLLQDGQVLVVGGLDPDVELDSVELFDPSSTSWTLVE